MPPLLDDQRARYGTYPDDVDAAVLAKFFHLDDADSIFVRRHNGSHQRLGFALQLCTVRYLGTFLSNPLDVPSVVVRHIARQLDVRDITGLPRYLERPDTYRNHAEEIRHQHGYHDFTAQPVHFRLVRWLYSRAWLTNERASVLFEHAVAWLIEHKVLLPGQTTLERLIATVQERSAARLWNVLAAAVSPAHQQCLTDLLVVPPRKRQSQLDQLRTPPVDVTATGLLAALRRLTAVRALGVSGTRLPAVPPGRFKAIARYALSARAQTIERIKDADRKVATLFAFATQLEATAQDDALDILAQIISAVFVANERKGQQARLRTLHDLDAAALLLKEVGQILLDTSYPDTEVRSRVFAKHTAEQVTAAIAEIQALTHPKHEPFVDQLRGQYAPIGRFLPTLLQTIQFHGTPGGQSVLDALQFLRQLDGPTPPKLHRAPTAVVGGRWKRLVLAQGEVTDRTLYTFAVLERLHQSLDRREVFVHPSERWGDPRAKLLSETAWTSLRGQVCRTLGRNTDPHAELALLGQQLTAAYTLTATNFATNTMVRLESRDGHDRPVITGLDKLDEPPSLRTLRKGTQRLIPQVDLAELVLEIHALTGFADAFTHISEGGSRAADLSLSICAVLVAEACNIGLEPLVQAEIPALTRDRLAWVQQNYMRHETLARANARLVAAQASIPIAKAWGGGEVASADGMRFVVPVRTINAGGSPKHFPRERGLTWYNGISDQNMGFNALVIPGALRDAPYLLNLLLEQQTHLQPQEVMTDTAGYSDTVFGLFWLLGYQFSPRLADLKDMRFWRIDPRADYGVLNDLGRHTIATKVVVDYWDELLRLAGSLKMGSVPADVVVRWLHGDKRPRSLARAVGELGRLAKTLYLLAYLDDDAYRRRILVQLNKGERRHSLARVIYHGQRGEVRQRYRQGQEDQLGALGLVLNCVVLWNTRYLDAAVNHLTTQGQEIRPEDLARLSPFTHRHINVLGRYSFAVPEAVQRGALRPLRDPATIDELEGL